MTGSSKTHGRARPRESRAVATIRCAVGPGGGVQWLRAPAALNLGRVEGTVDRLLLASVDRECLVASRPGGRSVKLWSLNHGERVELPVDGGAEVGGWRGRVAHVVRRLHALGRPPVGLDAVAYSELRSNSVLSADAPFDVACAVALCAAAEWFPGVQVLARACQGAEEGAGTAGEAAERVACLAGEEGAALEVELGSLDMRKVPMPAETRFVVGSTGSEPADVVFVEELQAAGATRARAGCLAGRSFVVGVCDHGRTDEIVVAAASAVRRRTGLEPGATVMRPAAGVGAL